MLYCNDLEKYGSVAQLVEQRLFKAKSPFLSLFKNSIYDAISTLIGMNRRSTGHEPKVKRTFLARAWHARGSLRLVRPVYFAHA